MSTSGTFHNESLSNYHIFQPLTSISAPLSSTIQSYQNSSYFLLPSQHNHSIGRKSSGRWDDLFIDDSDETLKFLKHQTELSYGDEKRESNNNTQANQSDKSLKDGRLNPSESSTNSRTGPANGNHLDPYIDAVQVKRRVNNKRGDRVKAADGGPNLQARTIQVKGADRVPDSSHYSKSVHIEESNGVSKEWDYSSDDSDDDEDDDHYHHKHHHHRSHKKKKGKSRGKKKFVKKRKPKKVYVAKVHHAKPMKHYGHYEHYGHGHHNKHKYDKHHNKHYGPEHEKKIVYVEYKKPAKKGHEQGYHQYEHEHHHDDHHHKKHHEHHHYHDKDSHHGRSKGKLVHLSVMSKGKMSLAGILGQTLLCVNYLLVLKQPTYDRYSSHYYTTYSPHGGHGDTVELKSRGPIILAHCGNLPQARELVKLATSPAADVRHLSVLPLSIVNNSNETRQMQRKLVSDQGQVMVDGSKLPSQPSTTGQANAVSAEKDVGTNLTTSEQQAELVYLGQGGGRPSSARYRSLAGFQADQQGSSLLSPIQSYLDRLFFVTPQSGPDSAVDNDAVQAFGLPRSQRMRVQNAGDSANLVPLERQAALADGRDGDALVVPNRRLVIVPGGQPQVVQARDNLVELRTRRVPIMMRIADGLRFGLDQRALSLTQQQDRAPESPLGLAVRAPDQLVQNDQPQPDDENRPVDATNVANVPQQPLDSPEYAIAGDTIELTCNHRLQPDRLYSVRWFKDSVEFYRFVPSGAPMKSSLMLPDVVTDVQRSNSQSLYLRNVTHRSSGLYRCEVISEAPNFELISGERMMRVYSLPSTGPRLNLLDRVESTTTTASIIASNGRLRTISSLATLNANGRGRTQLLGLEPTTRNPELEIEDGNEDDNRDWPPLPDGRIGLQTDAQRQQQQGAGPIVRCVSDRSNPVAQLQFSVNNRPVSAGRTIENSTLSYSDGLESNVISFRVQLSDFVLGADDRSLLDKAASLKPAADKTNGNGARTATTAATTATIATTTTTTTTTSTTTMRPKLNAARGREEKREKKARKEKKRQNADNANAAVQFDDHVSGGLASAKATEVGKKKEVTKEKRKNGDARPKSSRSQESSPRLLDHSSAEDEDADNSMQTMGHSDQSSQSGSLPAETSRFDMVGSAAGQQQQRVALGVTKTNGQMSPESRGARRSGSRSEASGGTQSPSIENESGLATDRPGDGDHLNGVEQRNSVTNRVRSRFSNSDQQRRQIIYSNFVRIKCISTVPTLGYEMISELNVPLTLIVPASRLSDALKQPTGNGGSGSLLQNINDRSDDNDSRLDEPRRNGESDVYGNQRDNGRQQQDGNTVGNFGSLQKPRAVVIDRVAQASGRQSSSVVYSSKRERSEEQERVERNKNEISHKGKNLARDNRMGISSGARSNVVSSSITLVAVLSRVLVPLLAKSSGSYATQLGPI